MVLIDPNTHHIHICPHNTPQRSPHIAPKITPHIASKITPPIAPKITPQSHLFLTSHLIYAPKITSHVCSQNNTSHMLQKSQLLCICMTYVDPKSTKGWILIKFYFFLTSLSTSSTCKENIDWKDGKLFSQET